ncbi:MAG: hypothetical protein ACE5NA_12805 [Nitrospiraceae bacterium]
MKILIPLMLSLLLTGMFSAHADESTYFELTIVTNDDLIDIPVRFKSKKICTEVGIAWAKADPELEGFVCAEEGGES